MRLRVTVGAAAAGTPRVSVPLPPALRSRWVLPTGHGGGRGRITYIDTLTDFFGENEKPTQARSGGYAFGNFAEMPTLNTFQECKHPVRRWTSTSFPVGTERHLSDIPALWK